MSTLNTRKDRDRNGKAKLIIIQGSQHLQVNGVTLQWIVGKLQYTGRS